MIKDYIGWDVGNWSGALQFWQSKLSNESGNKVLELGAGPGGLSLWLAQMNNHVVCSDIEEPGDTVKEFHKKFNFKGQIEYGKIDALNIPYENEFDIVIFKSIIGGVSRDGHDEKRDLMMAEILKVLKPNGIFLFAENTAGSKMHSLFRRIFIKWGSSWNYPTVNELTDSLSIFNDVNYETTGFLGTFGRTEWQRNILSQIDQKFLKYIVPSSWNYIMYGVAYKSPA